MHYQSWLPLFAFASVLMTAVSSPVECASGLPPARGATSGRQRAGSSGVSSKTSGEWAYATIRIDGARPRELFPDRTGFFPSVRVPADSILQFQVTYPKGMPGEVVWIEAEEKGKSKTQQTVSQGTLDGSRSLSFQVETTQSRLHARHKWSSRPLHFRLRSSAGLSLFRISLRKGKEVQCLLLWTDPSEE